MAISRIEGFRRRVDKGVLLTDSCEVIRANRSDRALSE